MTFTALVKLADFSKSPSASGQISDAAPEELTQDASESAVSASTTSASMGGIHYNIQLILPDSRDPKVFDALFRSLKEHLF